MPDEPEVAGLLALLLFTESRRHSRIAPDGSLLLLADQDRATWNHSLVAEARQLVDACLLRISRRRRRSELISARQPCTPSPGVTVSRSTNGWPQALYRPVSCKRC
jgi:predicted RNA polymerase sigma factor